MSEGSNDLRLQLARAYLKAQLIADIAEDYDGYRTVEGLMSLIDELKEMAHDLAKFCLESTTKEAYQIAVDELFSKKDC